MKRKFTYKQVIAVRTDLKMSKGKTAVQVAHGSISAYAKAAQNYSSWAKNWLNEGQKKVTVRTNSETLLYSLIEQAKQKDLPFAIINDAGLTELKPGTTTVICIGPAPEALVDEITGNLKLL